MLNPKFYENLVKKTNKELMEQFRNIERQCGMGYDEAMEEMADGFKNEIMKRLNGGNKNG